MYLVLESPAGRAILILTFFRNHYFACSQVLPLASRFSKLFLFLLYDLSFPCGYFFFGFNGNFNRKMTKINKKAKNHFFGVQNGSQSV